MANVCTGVLGRRSSQWIQLFAQMCSDGMETSARGARRRTRGAGCSDGEAHDARTPVTIRGEQLEASHVVFNARLHLQTPHLRARQRQIRHTATEQPAIHSEAHHSTDLPAMAPRKQANQPSPAAVSPSAAKHSSAVSSASSQPTKAQNKQSQPPAGGIRNAQDVQEIAIGVWNGYVDKTPQRTKLLDAFMAFLVIVGVLQFAYCVVAGNYVRLTLVD